MDQIVEYLGHRIEQKAETAMVLNFLLRSIVMYCQSCSLEARDTFIV